MDVQMRAELPDDAGSRLEPMLIRLPPTLADRLRRLARTTRIRQSDYLREAVADLLDKYAHVDGVPRRAEPSEP
jgi:Arc/MetJ-type ribon-helix-helix transcriptional regulator